VVTEETVVAVVTEAIVADVVISVAIVATGVEIAVTVVAPVMVATEASVVVLRLPLINRRSLCLMKNHNLQRSFRSLYSAAVLYQRAAVLFRGYFICEKAVIPFDRSYKLYLTAG
jgi:hypothetical protein